MRQRQRDRGTAPLRWLNAPGLSQNSSNRGMSAIKQMSCGIQPTSFHLPGVFSGLNEHGPRCAAGARSNDFRKPTSSLAAGLDESAGGRLDQGGAQGSGEGRSEGGPDEACRRGRGHGVSKATRRAGLLRSSETAFGPFGFLAFPAVLRCHSSNVMLMQVSAAQPSAAARLAAAAGRCEGQGGAAFMRAAQLRFRSRIGTSTMRSASGA